MAESQPSSQNNEQSPNPFNDNEGLHADVEQPATHPEPLIAADETATDHPQ